MNKSFIKFLLGLVIICCEIPMDCIGQDPQFSQFYAAPLYLNPAFTGGAMNPRFVANYRNQWPGLSANFVTSSFSIDNFFEKYNSGVGLLVTNDTQGIGNLKSTDVGLTYSYMFRLDDNTNVRFGMQGSYVNKSVDYDGLIFRYDPFGTSFTPVTKDPILTNSNPINYVDFSTGALLYNEKSWFGVSVHHLGRPQQLFDPALAGGDNNNLPMKISVQGGINLPVISNFGGGRGVNMDKELIATPTFLFKHQGGFNQLDAGVYLTYAPMTLGLWYRGIPIVKTQDGLNNQDAFIALLGYRMDNFSFGYSYDLTISKLSPASGGAHEISVSYLLNLDKDKSPNIRRKKKELSCPKF